MSRKRHSYYICILLACFLLCCAGCRPAVDTAWGEDLLRVHFIDVGQGDAILLQMPSGEAVLVDGGPRDRGEEVAVYLARQGVQELHLLVATHPHEDHIGGLPEILEQFPVQAAWDAGRVHTSRSYEEYLEALLASPAEYTAAYPGLTAVLGEVTLTVLHPAENGLEDLNNNSVVLRVEHGAVAMLLAGDLEEEGEALLLEGGYPIQAQLLKVGHHGSDSSSGPAFLAAVKPEIAVISCGSDNAYGHPHEAALERLRRCGAEVYRTDLEGTIIVGSDGTAMYIRREPESSPEDIFWRLLEELLSKAGSWRHPMMTA